MLGGCDRYDMTTEFIIVQKAKHYLFTAPLELSFLDSNTSSYICCRSKLYNKTSSCNLL